MVHDLPVGYNLEVVALFADQAPAAPKALGRVDDRVLGVELAEEVVDPILPFYVWGLRRGVFQKSSL